MIASKLKVQLSSEPRCQCGAGIRTRGHCCLLGERKAEAPKFTLTQAFRSFFPFLLGWFFVLPLMLWRSALEGDRSNAVMWEACSEAVEIKTEILHLIKACVGHAFSPIPLTGGNCWRRGELCSRARCADSFPLDFCNDAGNTVTEKGHQDGAELPWTQMPGRQREWTGLGVLWLRVW